MEIWKDVEGFEGLYQINNLGNVRSIDRTVNRCGFKGGKMLSAFENGCGYLKVNLWKQNKCKKMYVHRLVAIAFLNNPDNLPQVNHKNENKKDNTAENLEWCSSKYNMNYGTANLRRVKNRDEQQISKCKYRPVYQILPSGEKVRFDSIKCASEYLKIKHNGIVVACRKGIRAGGYKWEYAPRQVV